MNMELRFLNLAEYCWHTCAASLAVWVVTVVYYYILRYRNQLINIRCPVMVRILALWLLTALQTCFETAHHIIGCQLYKYIDPN
jgi:peptidoglycan biosynthesis protein MviN/MurJ (putative lipid II flippase)